MDGRAMLPAGNPIALRWRLSETGTQASPAWAGIAQTRINRLSK